MGATSVGQGGGRDANENEVTPAQPKTFGEEGTNKTQPVPDPKAQPSDVPGRGKHMEPTPYVR
jgi:hypothetical protein